ncbi:MAG: hydrogenase expression/formation protein HypE [Candidatus Omnitrophica bacterium]|nr:hydrogenase expression/formation protein HypE [Candidatus Omnitrophota bacterium]MDD5592549.1 hydrogenase expression/formation protein HypE [Candidatus Omnitrophota bacterium]
MFSNKILLGHGSGGELMHSLIKGLFLKKLHNPILKELSDSARINYKEKLAFSTDSFVVSPLFFPGGDIGKLAVCGTINDLVVSGAVPEYLSLAFILEEGLDYGILEKVVDSLSFHANRAGVCIVTGDIKVVERGACDKIFINTCGIGRILKNKKLCVKNIEPADKIILTGGIARHGLAVLAKRKELSLGFNIKSDCAALNDLILPILKRTDSVKFMRDPTRGGIATTLNEIAQSRRLGIIIDEKSIPISAKVKVASELLGIDPLYIANEGNAVMVVSPDGADKVLTLLRKHPLGRNAQEIGVVTRQPKATVVLKTIVGTQRIVDMLTSEPLPRIC